MARTGNLSYGLAQTHRHGFEMLTRAGLAAKGVVYMLIGILALMAALGEGGETTNSKGAVSRIAEQPFGEFALFLIGIGLIGYAVWRIACAFLDREHEGSDAKGVGKRTYYFVSALIYISTAIFAFRLAMGDGASGGGGGSTQTWTARLMDQPMGVFLVVLIGGAIVAAGIGQILEGWREKFREHLRSLPAGHEWVIRAGKWGYMARGVVFSIMGLFAIQAALQHNPGQVRGMEGALDSLARQPFGQILLALVAAGLACYGAYTLVESRYRTV
jgi:hypothetical protein